MLKIVFKPTYLWRKVFYSHWHATVQMLDSLWCSIKFCQYFLLWSQKLRKVSVQVTVSVSYTHFTAWKAFWAEMCVSSHYCRVGCAEIKKKYYLINEGKVFKTYLRWCHIWCVLPGFQQQQIVRHSEKIWQCLWGLAA